MSSGRKGCREGGQGTALDGKSGADWAGNRVSKRAAKCIQGCKICFGLVSRASWLKLESGVGTEGELKKPEREGQEGREESFWHSSMPSCATREGTPCESMWRRREGGKRQRGDVAVGSANQTTSAMDRCTGAHEQGGGGRSSKRDQAEGSCARATEAVGTHTHARTHARP